MMVSANYGATVIQEMPLEFFLNYLVRNNSEKKKQRPGRYTSFYTLDMFMKSQV